MKANSILILVICLLLATLVYIDPWKEPIEDNTPYYMEQIETANKATREAEARADTMYQKAELASARSKELIKLRKINTLKDEDYIHRHVVDASADSVLLFARQISDSIIRVGYSRTDAN